MNVTESKATDGTSLISSPHLTFADIRNAHRVLLGRPVESTQAVLGRVGMHRDELVVDLVGSDEFRSTIAAHSILTGFVAPGRFDDEPRPQLLEWAAHFLPLVPTTRDALQRAETWRAVLRLIFADEIFQPIATRGLSTFKGLFLNSFLDQSDDVPLSGGSTTRLQMPQSFSPDMSLIVADASIPPTPDSRLLEEKGQNLARIRALHGLRMNGHSFVSAGDDPQIAIARSIRPGAYVLSMRATYREPTNVKDPITGVFYIDSGAGFSEEQTWQIVTTTGHLTITALLETKKLIRQLRFDPSPHACTIDFDQLSLRAADMAI